MVILNNSTINRIDRIRKYKKIACVFDYFFFVVMVAFTCVAIFLDTYELYSYFIVAILLSKGAVRSVSSLFNDPTEEVLEVIQYDRAKFKYKNTTTCSL